MSFSSVFVLSSALFMSPIAVSGEMLTSTLANCVFICRSNDVSLSSRPFLSVFNWFIAFSLILLFFCFALSYVSKNFSFISRTDFIDVDNVGTSMFAHESALLNIEFAVSIVLFISGNLLSVFLIATLYRAHSSRESPSIYKVTISSLTFVMNP